MFICFFEVRGIEGDEKQVSTNSIGDLCRNRIHVCVCVFSKLPSSAPNILEVGRWTHIKHFSINDQRTLLRMWTDCEGVLRIYEDGTKSWAQRPRGRLIADL